MKKYFIKIIIIMFLIIISEYCFAQKSNKKPSKSQHNIPTPQKFTPALDIKDQTPIEIKGQTRSLNINLLLQTQKDEIHFIKLRENYKKEILETKY